MKRKIDLNEMRISSKCLEFGLPGMQTFFPSMEAAPLLQTRVARHPSGWDGGFQFFPQTTEALFKGLDRLELGNI